MASLLPVPKARFFDANGLPLAGGRVFTYIAGTNTPQETYKEQAGITANTNPVILDSRGEADIWLVGTYKIVLQNASATQQWSVDNIQDIATQIGGAYGNIQNIYAGTTGGTANQITATPTPALEALTVGQQVRALIFQNNTGGATLNVSGLGDVAIRKKIGNQLVPLDDGDLVSGRIESFNYDGTFWVVSGIERRTPNAKAANYTVLATDINGNITVDATSGPITITLPLLSTVQPDYKVTVTKVDSTANVVTVSASGSDGIGTVSSVLLSNQYDSVEFISDGSVWLSSNLSPPILVNYFTGYGLANNISDAANDLDIAAGMATDTTGTYYLKGAPMTKRSDATWSVGTNNGFLDTGAIGNGTYHVFVIRKDSDGSIDYLLSLSPTSPTMPSGYSARRRIGSIVRAAGAILPFVQYEDEFYLKTPVLDVNDLTTGTTAKTATLASIPTGILVKAILNIYVAGNGTFVYVSPLAANDLAASITVAPLISLGSGAANSTSNIMVWTNTSAQIRYRTTANDVVRMASLGWIDKR